MTCQEILEENQRSVEQQLTAMRFATADLLPKPTILGVLVVGNDPRQFVPCAYIQFLRIDGGELTDPIKDQKEIGGPLPDILDISEKQCRDAKFRVSTRVVSNAQLISGDVYCGYLTKL